jgi:hypothetical protein
VQEGEEYPATGAPGQRSEEFRLREQQGLSSPETSEYSSSDEEEE